MYKDPMKSPLPDVNDQMLDQHGHSVHHVQLVEASHPHKQQTSPRCDIDNHADLPNQCLVQPHRKTVLRLIVQDHLRLAQ